MGEIELLIWVFTICIQYFILLSENSIPDAPSRPTGDILMSTERSQAPKAHIVPWNEHNGWVVRVWN